MELYSLLVEIDPQPVDLKDHLGGELDLCCESGLSHCELLDVDLDVERDACLLVRPANQVGAVVLTGIGLEAYRMSPVENPGSGETEVLFATTDHRSPDDHG